MTLSPKERAEAKHRAMSAEEHTTRARALLADAQGEPDGEKAFILMQAAGVHSRYAEDPVPVP